MSYENQTTSVTLICPDYEDVESYLHSDSAMAQLFQRGQLELSEIHDHGGRDVPYYWFFDGQSYICTSDKDYYESLRAPKEEGEVIPEFLPKEPPIAELFGTWAKWRLDYWHWRFVNANWNTPSCIQADQMYSLWGEAVKQLNISAHPSFIVIKSEKREIGQTVDGEGTVGSVNVDESDAVKRLEDIAQNQDQVFMNWLSRSIGELQRKMEDRELSHIELDVFSELEKIRLEYTSRHHHAERFEVEVITRTKAIIDREEV